jgi:hypothetical protein
VHTGTIVASQYPYEWDISTLGIGNHTLTVEATDSQLIETLREQRTIKIDPRPTPTPLPPMIMGATDSAPVNLAIWLIPLLLILVVVLFVWQYRTQGRVQAAVAMGVQGVKSATMKLTQKLGPAKPSMARLMVTRGQNHGQEYRLREAVTTFGREQSVSDNVIPGAFVSSCHFSIMYNAQQQAFYIMDNKSANGTFVNRQPIAPQQYVPLPFGSTIGIGQNHDVELLFQPVMRTTRVLGSNP